MASWTQSPHMVAWFDLAASAYFTIFGLIAWKIRRIPLGYRTGVARANNRRLYWSLLSACPVIVIWTAVHGLLQLTVS